MLVETINGPQLRVSANDGHKSEVVENENEGYLDENMQKNYEMLIQNR